MSSKPLRYLLVCLTLGGSVVACGKKEPEAPAVEKPDEPSEAAAKDEPDTSEDVAPAKEDTNEQGKGKHPRDRLNRRPHGRDADAESGAEGPSEDALKDAPSKLGRDRIGDLKRPIEMPNIANNGNNPSIQPPSEANPLLVPTPGEMNGEEPSVPPMIEPGGAPSAGGPGDPSVPAVGVPGAPAEPTPGQRPSPRDAALHGAALDATRLMPLPVVLDATKGKGLVDAGVLPGIATGQGYVSILYKGPAADKFGVSLQAWQDPGRREADDRFKRMRLQYPHAEDVKALEPLKAFYSQFNGIQMLTFVDSVKRVVATVACGDAYCSHEQLTKLAKSVRERL